MLMPLDYPDPRDSLANAFKNNCYGQGEITLIQINAGFSNGNFSAIIRLCVSASFKVFDLFSHTETKGGLEVRFHGSKTMGLILLLVVLVLLFGGGGFYVGPPFHYYGGGLSLILVIVILVILFRR